MSQVAVDEAVVLVEGLVVYAVVVVVVDPELLEDVSASWCCQRQRRSCCIPPLRWQHRLRVLVKASARLFSVEVRRRTS